MISTLNFIALSSFLTIDRIEGNYAVIEWGNGAISSVPLSFLSNEISEGEIFSYSLQGVADGAEVIRSCPPIFKMEKDTFMIPLDIQLPVGETYRLELDDDRQTRPERYQYKLWNHMPVWSTK